MDKQTWVVGTANGNIPAHLILDIDIDIGCSRSAKCPLAWIGEEKSIVLAGESSDGLASGTLFGRPLPLEVSFWASIRAERTIKTAVVAFALSAGDGENVIVSGSAILHGLLDTSPST